jgi:hypothetical protein
MLTHKSPREAAFGPRPSRLIHLVPLAFLALLGACGSGSDTPGGNPAPGGGSVLGADRIFFTSNRTADQRPRIFSMAADGSDVVQLDLFSGLNPLLLTDITFSADGTKALGSFDFGTGAGTQLVISPTDGGAATDLKPALGLALDAGKLSPDGSKVAFVTGATGAAPARILVANADGSGATERHTAKSPGESPHLLGFGGDNATLYFFVSTFTGTTTVDSYYRLDPGSSTPVAVTTLAGLVGDNRVSADGTSILGRRFAGSNSQIILSAISDGSVTALTGGTSLDSDPTYSRDRTKIYFTSNRDGNLEIYSMNPDGSGPARLTFNAARDDDPVTRAQRFKNMLRLLR